MRPGLRKYVKAVLNLVTAVVLLCLAVFLLPRLLRFSCLLRWAGSSP